MQSVICYMLLRQIADPVRGYNPTSLCKALSRVPVLEQAVRNALAWPPTNWVPNALNGPHPFDNDINGRSPPLT